MKQKTYSVRFDLVAECETVPMDLSKRIDAKEWISQSLDHIPQLKKGLPFTLSDLSLEKVRGSFTKNQLYFASFTVYSQGLIINVLGYSEKDVLNYLKSNNNWLTSVFIVVKKHMIFNTSITENIT